MNILHIMEDYKPTIGGSVVRNGNMIDSYHDRYPSDDVYLINLEGNLYKNESDEKGIHVYRAKNIMEQIRLAHRLVREKKINVIHTHNFRFLFVGFAAKALLNIKIVNEIHALYRMSFLKEFISYFLLRRTDHVIVLAESAKDYLVEHHRIKKEKIIVIRNGIEKIGESRKSQPKEEEVFKKVKEAKEQGFVIASYNGSFIEWQGVRVLADQMEYLLGMCDNLFLLLLGNGAEYDYVKEKSLMCKYNERIFIHSGVPKDEMHWLYEMIDIVLIPRIKSLKTDTAVPLKAIEAMQYSKCILASGDDGIKEILNPKNAVLYEPGSNEDFQEKIKLLVSNKELREKLGEQANLDAAKLLVTWKENSAKVNALYKAE